MPSFRTLATLVPFAIFWAAPTFAQQITSDPSFPRPAYFRRHFGTTLTHVELQPPTRLADYVVDGKFELSLKNYLELVMANNPDISIQKVTLELARDAVLRAFSIFDPVASASFSTTRTETPSGSVLSGVPVSGAAGQVQIAVLNQLIQPLTLGYQQTMETGTQYNVTFGSTKLSTNSAFATFNPQLSAGLTFTMTQPLLKNRGRLITRLPISIARSQLRSGEYGLQDQLTQLVASAESAYWDAVFAREDLRVQEESLKLAGAALKRAQKELELGATSSLEIYQPEATFANAQLTVAQARYRLAQAEDALRRQMGVDLAPDYQRLPVVLTESIAAPPDTARTDAEAAVQQALQTRFDLKSAVQNLDIDDLHIRQADNNLRPELSLVAQYGSSGLGGIFFPGANLIGGVPVAPIPGGIADALGGVFGFGYPVYGFGLTLRLPIRDRKAAADLADAQVQKKLDSLRQRSLEETIRLQVLTAVNQLENSKESIRLAAQVRDLSRKRVEADQKRYELGTTTLFFVLASQGDYVNAESNLVNQLISYKRNKLQLLQRTGQLLEERGILVL
jgi:outer membrane protein